MSPPADDVRPMRTSKPPLTDVVAEFEDLQLDLTNLLSNIGDELVSSEVDADALRKHAIELKDSAKLFRQKGRVLAARYAEVGAVDEGRTLRFESFRLDTHATETLKVIKSTLKSVGAKSLTLNESVNSWLNKSYSDPSQIPAETAHQAGSLPISESANGSVNSVQSVKSDTSAKSVPNNNTSKEFATNSSTMDSLTTIRENLPVKSNASNLSDITSNFVLKTSVPDTNDNNLITTTDTNDNNLITTKEQGLNVKFSLPQTSNVQNSNTVLATTTSCYSSGINSSIFNTQPKSSMTSVPPGNLHIPAYHPISSLGNVNPSYFPYSPASMQQPYSTMGMTHVPYGMPMYAPPVGGNPCSTNTPAHSTHNVPQGPSVKASSAESEGVLKVMSRHLLQQDSLKKSIQSFNDDPIYFWPWLIVWLHRPP